MKADNERSFSIINVNEKILRNYEQSESSKHEDILYHHRIRIVPRMPGWFCGIYSIKALRKLVEEGNFLNL